MATRTAPEKGERKSTDDRDEGLASRLSSIGKGKRKTLILLVVVVIFACVGYALYSYFSSSWYKQHVIDVSGRIEAEETHIASPAVTRVKEVRVREGDDVRKGQLIIVLDSQNLNNKMAMADRALRRARAAEAQAAHQERAINQDVRVVQAGSKGLKGFFSRLFSTKAGRAKKEADLRGDVLAVKMASLQAKGAVTKIQALKSEAASKLSFFKITSTVDGICETRSAEPGELVDKGQVILTIVDPKTAYVRGFISEGDLAKVKIGQKAKVYPDSNADVTPLDGKVIEIDSKPSFTPQNVYFKDDRVRQTFGLKIAIDHPDGLTKPGVRADAKILLKPDRSERSSPARINNGGTS